MRTAITVTAIVAASLAANSCRTKLGTSARAYDTKRVGSDGAVTFSCMPN